jgi:hypothetical protein
MAMSFGKGSVPDGCVARTFRVKVMATPAKRKRAYGLLVSGGDAWAWSIDRFHARARDGLANANSVVQMWPDQKGHGAFGELSVHCAQDVTKAWSAAFFETMKRRKKGEQARLPLRKKWLVPVTWRKGEFTLSAASEGRRPGPCYLRPGATPTWNWPCQATTPMTPNWSERCGS